MQTLDQLVLFQCMSNRCIRYSTKADRVCYPWGACPQLWSNSRYFQLYMMTFRTPGLSVIPRGFWHMCRNDSELASASLSASLVSFKRWSSLYMVIQAGILASWANMSKQKGMLSPEPEGFFRTWSNQASFCFFFPEVGTRAGMGTCTDVVCCCISSVICSYYFKYDFSDRVPVGWGISACVVQASSFLLQNHWAKLT